MNSSRYHSHLASSFVSSVFVSEVEDGTHLFILQQQIINSRFKVLMGLELHRLGPLEWLLGNQSYCGVIDFQDLVQPT